MRPQLGRAIIGVVILIVSTLLAGCAPASPMQAGGNLPESSPSPSPDGRASSPTPSPVIATTEPPVIVSLSSWADWVDRNGKTQITCVAQDLESDRLGYTWSATAGTITGQGATVTWTAPAVAGQYSILVIVSDKDGAASEDLTLKVADQVSAPPQIKAVVTDPVFRQIGDDITVTVTCIAFDPDGDEIVEYEWSTTAGTISGTGKTIVWTPGLVPEPVDQTLLLRLTDSRGDHSQGALIRFTVLPILPCPG